MEAHLFFAIVLLPLFAAVVSGILQNVIGHVNVMRLTCAAVTVSAVLSLHAFIQIGFKGAPIVEATLYEWINTQHLSLSFGVLVDKLTVTMLLVVTSVSACVHYYSVGYMAHDPSRGRFFSYLSFFTFTMLALVTAPNLVQMFLGWEGVGLASYLLIGFWFKKESANAASIKAFLVNRVADIGLLLAIFTTFALFGTLEYSEIFAILPSKVGQGFTFLGYEMPLISLIAIFLLIGAMGKSAQIGFHTWLPDAMEGPTPVSALIHAATMVTAGVFLLARMSPLFELSGDVMLLVAWVGGLTALFAATIGLVQNDIKRVIAYSTCSQLGYMFFACGIGAYPAAIFHLTTHAFFKALLFLGAGSVIHGMGDEQDMRKMGGLRKLLPITHGLMWIGSLALMGIPPFAGFFSKDLILESAFMSGTPMGQALYVVGTVAALMTAFYSCRVLYLTFYAQPRASKTTIKHVHESPAIMIVPMAVLAVGAVVSGYMLHGMGDIAWWENAIVVDTTLHVGLENAHHTPAVIKYLPLGIVLFGMALATLFYIKKTSLPALTAKAFKPLHALFYNKWYVDEFYTAVVVKPLSVLSSLLWQWGDVKGIDGLGPNGVAYTTRKLATLLRRTQTGYLYHYAFVLTIGFTALLAWLLF